MVSHDQLIEAATDAAVRLKLGFEIAGLLSIEQWHAEGRPVIYSVGNEVWVAEVRPVVPVMMVDGPVVVILLDEVGDVVGHHVLR